MTSNVQILDIVDGSDGDSQLWPNNGYTRNDAYFRERLGAQWAKDRFGNVAPGVVYWLNKLPDGYAGFEKQRAATSKSHSHRDRYIYGHPQGHFRSLVEFWPHFKHLMDFGDSEGCQCHRCSGEAKKKRAQPNAQLGPSTRAAPSAPAAASTSALDSAIDPALLETQPAAQPSANIRTGDVQQRLDNSAGLQNPLKRKATDIEGITDVYEHLIDRLKAAEGNRCLDAVITESTSPDWQASHDSVNRQIDESKRVPGFIPRKGELILFVRKVDEDESISWDQGTQTFRLTDTASGTWLQPPKWEAGVVTQLPIEAIMDSDLTTDRHKEQSVTTSGFRVEPLSEPGSNQKLYAKQHTYVPLRAVRPFILWQACLNGLPEDAWHGSIKHALSVTSSFSVIGRHLFSGEWPNATVFCTGAYLGSELVMIGDTVRLLPHKNEKIITDVLLVTAIRLVFANLDLDEDDTMADSITGRLPYQTCLHISGRVYTRDPTRTFDGLGVVPSDMHSTEFPGVLNGYGPWYHCPDRSTRVELPYTRILGRCHEPVAIKAWFETGPKAVPPASFQAVNADDDVAPRQGEDAFSRGLQAFRLARSYSLKHNKNINTDQGKSSFWADTRVEQLDLHTLNDQSVGAKNSKRAVDLGKWKLAIKSNHLHPSTDVAFAPSANRGDTANPHSRNIAAAALAATTTADSTSDDEQRSSDEATDPSTTVANKGKGRALEADGRQGQHPSSLRGMGNITLSDDEEDAVEEQLASELAKNIRAG